jgi:hypothetical protein
MEAEGTEAEDGMEAVGGTEEDGTVVVGAAAVGVVVVGLVVVGLVAVGLVAVGVGVVAGTGAVGDPAGVGVVTIPTTPTIRIRTIHTVPGAVINRKGPGIT